MPRRQQSRFTPPSDKPSFAQNPEIWERWWQQTIDAFYILKTRTLPSQLPTFKKTGDSLVSQETSLQFQVLAHRKLLEVQDTLRELALKKSAVDDFPALWKALGSDGRKKHYFEAMRRACSMPDTEIQRQYCPEVSWKAFEANGGQGYLDMLTVLSRECPEKQYINIENELVNSSFGIRTTWDTRHALTTDPILFMQREFIIRRMFFISAVTRSIMLSYYGHVEHFAVHTPQRGSKLMAAVREGGELHGLSESEIRSDKKNYKKIVKELGHSMCMSCNWYDFEFAIKGKEVKFKSCARCKAIGREILYCSKECQLEDWKNGDPPHKAICGKSLLEATPQQVDVAPSTSATSKSRFPPPKNGYLRSPALQYILGGLEEVPDVDYIFVWPQGIKDMPLAPVILYTAIEKEYFKEQLNRAVTTGDAAAVQNMYEVLKSYASEPGNIGVAVLKKQLKREYGVDVVGK